MRLEYTHTHTHTHTHTPQSVESRTERKEPVHTGRTPSAPLSPTARRLLTEFGLRYGVVRETNVQS